MFFSVGSWLPITCYLMIGAARYTYNIGVIFDDTINTYE